jgi:hypothetical protein
MAVLATLRERLRRQQHLGLDRAVRQLRAQGVAVPDDLLAHVARLGWEHIGLTGDYVWT